MKSKYSRPPVPNNGKKSQPSPTKNFVASPWDDQPDLLDEPEMPELEIDWNEIPDHDEFSNNIREPRNSFHFLSDYWLNSTNENSEQCQLDGVEGALSYADVIQEN